MQEFQEKAECLHCDKPADPKSKCVYCEVVCCTNCIKSSDMVCVACAFDIRMKDV